jgi:hypothetical protein
MDSLTDEHNTWFNAVRLEDSHDYSSATLAYIEDAGHCLSRNFLIRAAMSTTCAASCVATLGDAVDALKLYSAAAMLYERNADLSIGKSLRESLWSLLHAFEYFTLISDHAGAERVSKKYADLARRVDRFEAHNIFEALEARRENVLSVSSSLGSPITGNSLSKNQDLGRIQKSIKAFLQQVQAVNLPFLEPPEFEDTPPMNPEIQEEEGLVYETEADYLERRIVS